MQQEYQENQNMSNYSSMNQQSDSQQPNNIVGSQEQNPNSTIENELLKAKQHIEKIKQQISESENSFLSMKKQFYIEKDFFVSKFVAYPGPNYYMDRNALVFNIYIAPTGKTVDFYRNKIAAVFPEFANNNKKYVVDLFADVLLYILKMDINLFINKYEISYDDDEYVIAIEYLDKYVAEDCVYVVSDWFKAMNNEEEFDIKSKWLKLQADFDKTFFGGPTLYSLIEAGMKREIPVIYLYEENQFMWGYGIKQLRGRSTTFHIDSIKDTEFTMYKDMVGEFLEMCGFPVPKTENVFSEEEAINAAKRIGYPCVLKPVAGHKGQGVTTGVMDEKQVCEAFQKVLNLSQEQDISFDGVLVQQQIFGTDHRLLAVNGKFVAALERVPAYVDGDGIHNIEQLIEIENEKEIRLDNARSPLCKIRIDEDMLNFLKLQSIDLNYIPKQNERITLRRVANISAGGVSINVTDKIHPENIQLVEDIASFFKVKCLGIDVLAQDISKSWKEGNFGIIEINAGPGVFMHLAPAYGGSIDVPGKIILSHFKHPKNARIPIIAANYVSNNLVEKLLKSIKELDPNTFFGYLIDDGVYFNGRYFHNNPDHIQNQKIVLRHPQTSFALFVHEKNNIYDYGLLHQGADIVILDEASYTEEKVLLGQLFENCPLVEIIEDRVDLLVNDKILEYRYFTTPEEKDEIILEMIKRYLPDLIKKYSL